MTFEEYLLGESVEPVETKYGTNPPDFDNARFSKFGSNVQGTMFNYGDYSYFVQHNLETGEIGFGKTDKITSEDELMSATFDTNSVGNSDGLGVFNRSFYVLVKLLESSHKKDIFFSGASTKLDKMCSILAKSKFFNKIINDIGYSNLYVKDGLYGADYD